MRWWACGVVGVSCLCLGSGFEGARKKRGEIFMELYAASCGGSESGVSCDTAFRQEEAVMHKVREGEGFGVFRTEGA